MLKTNKLYIVPTPIGNLEDMTFRAIRILKEVNLIFAENTRTTSFLLNHFDIKTRMQSCHKYNEHETVKQITWRIKIGENIALISDAGMPGISDPGFLLIRECIQQRIGIECLPGATAFVPALINSGLPIDHFCFEGFLPRKKGRQTKFEELTEEIRTIIIYESPFRIVKTLEQLAEYLGEKRLASISREISKLYEETIRGTLKDLILHFTKNKPKGEFVLVVSGKKFKS
ncbi:MAG: 16S rRNA (cytidine(1402)-2'-O)-methyltransferase [Candidatus Azobacteroides pseudotrichonymphae]|jgi:16S rRNA (cytidine1402-2'-O)-methyltransferase|uniref:Ribosomal RNA small subunit methyltransferase I n=1 Tax=Azobacteroides pseudotrichonymphae genomovar. CFP2 TaxID=511995 RepID=B6YRK3_AZOPC|nr:16S rRNA (cytidine(1402)-2'-O)-methyltransferase [Candidatus Azobacteroides pseudotrichonymphae]MDR0530173.1 16S rRNA (cytidine(1402)-2'-O)-methyltransferase [Bacteroidales bacterium OttesenSCG-928-I14]BAG83825.1 putative methyltransferase [Candidatus Azobacteroides pseudotrichonymphae genomovar. CFP2]GMO35580.1 MAG: 16S rRNA (cytidine(1402)-2'-O)-methyltransferase [Candidatus Azobacteroides pseudotrichonymphae]